MTDAEIRPIRQVEPDPLALLFFAITQACSERHWPWDNVQFQVINVAIRSTRWRITIEPADD